MEFSKSMFPFCRVHPPSSDFRSRDRLHLPFLELRLWRTGRLPAVRQREIQTPLRQPRHHPQERGLPPLQHRLVLPARELQEVHQRKRGPLDADRVLPISQRQRKICRQDKVYIQPRGP